jgi:multidrug efflux pump subunit AcrA (membrane-fusion protein)
MLLSYQTTQNISAFYLSKQKGGSIIYFVVLLVFTLTIAALPFITIPITFQSRGQIRPVAESNSIISSLPAQIREVNLKENELVQKGATLLVLNTDKLQEKILLNQTKLVEKY